MGTFLFVVFVALAAFFFALFLRGKYDVSPLWLMLSAWMLALGVPQLRLSPLEKPWPLEFILLIAVSLVSFICGYLVFKKIFVKHPFWRKIPRLLRKDLSPVLLRLVIYGFAALSAVGLYLFYIKAGNFPLLAPDPDVFRFAADEQVPGLINYTAQLARLFIPLSFFLMFWQGFSLKRHWDLAALSILGTAVLILFASRTQIYFVDLWVMALYLLVRKPNLKQAIKFYPFFLIISVVVLAAVPLIRQAKSYGDNYLAGVTEIDASRMPKATTYVLPIYVGISFNMQALLHADQYYETHPTQSGKVSLYPFTNLLKAENLAPHYDLGDIFKSWWNTGTYLFPFVMDFGKSAFLFVPFLIAGVLTLVWRFWQDTQNFLSANLYAYACFFIVMTIYLSFTVRAEMYIDLFLLLMSYLFITSWRKILEGSYPSNSSKSY